MIRKNENWRYCVSWWWIILGRSRYAVLSIVVLVSVVVVVVVVVVMVMVAVAVWFMTDEVATGD